MMRGAHKNGATANKLILGGASTLDFGSCVTIPIFVAFL